MKFNTISLWLISCAALEISCKPLIFLSTWFSIFRKSNSVKFQVGPLHLSSNNHGGSCTTVINFLLVNLLSEDRLEFSFLLIYLNKTSFDSMIYLTVLFTNTGFAVAPLIHDKTHIESDPRKQSMLGICNCFFTDCKFVTPINTCNSSEWGIGSVFFGTTLEKKFIIKTLFLFHLGTVQGRLSLNRLSQMHHRKQNSSVDSLPT